MDLSVVVAAYNEAPILTGTIRRLVETLVGRPERSWELILVDDGSSDQTGEILALAAETDSRLRVIAMARNGGQGKALRAGFALAQGDVLVTMDADLSYQPNNIWMLYDALFQEQADVALASPYMKGGVVNNVPAYRRWLSRWGNRYLAMMISNQVSTVTCVVRAYRRHVIDAMFLNSSGMELQLEILMKALMLQFRLVEVPAELTWSRDKARNASLGRVSKMRILHTIRLYFQMGWLTRPAFLFLVMGGMFFLPGLYMLLVFFWLAAGHAHLHTASGMDWNHAVSLGLQATFNQFTHTLIIGTILIFAGALIWLFSLIFMQNRYHFQELYMVCQGSLKRIEELEKKARASGASREP